MWFDWELKETLIRGPLSPYLYSIGMEFLTINLDLEYMKGNFTPIYKIEPLITHLLYVYDIIILAKASITNANCIRKTFQNLKILAGLDLNEKKSTLYFSNHNPNSKLQIV